MKSKYIYTTLVCLLASVLMTSCFDLSGLLYNPSQLEEYKYDNFDPENNLPSDYDVLSGEINEFTVESDFDGDMATIYGSYIGDLSTIAEDTVVLYCHGNAAHMDLYFQRTKMIYHANGKSNYGVLAFDYRGFGRSEGTTVEKSIIADTKAMINWLKDQGVSGDRLIVYGFSLGSIAAVSSCVNDLGLRPSKLMLEAPIGSIDAMAQDGSGLSIQGSLFASLETNHIEDIKQIEQPFYWLHGETDDFLAMLTHGFPIFENHNGEFKAFELVPEGNHGDTPFILGVDEYIASISAFIRQSE